MCLVKVTQFKIHIFSKIKEAVIAYQNAYTDVCGGSCCRGYLQVLILAMMAQTKSENNSG